MEVKRVVCPNCKAILSVKNTKNELVKEVHCPNCGSTLKVNFEKQKEPLEAHTYIVPQKKQQVDKGETVIGGVFPTGTIPSSEATQMAPDVKKSKRASLKYGGVAYPLAEGQNIIGRKGTTSKATVQIGTDDMYMSRQHATIVLSTLPDGSLKAVLSNYQNKNATSVDGQDIEPGDQIRLTDGNRITMGRTTLIFRIT